MARVVLEVRQIDGTVTPSPTASPSSSSTSTSPDSSSSSYNLPSGGVSSSIYLFTFLITILVLGIITVGLVLRAFLIRRRFQRRVQEALARGETLPEAETYRIFGIGSPTTLRPVPKEAMLGPKPFIWESEMYRDDEDVEDYNPLTVFRSTQSSPSRGQHPHADSAPAAGDEVSVGVIIALPSEGGEDSWIMQEGEEEEKEVPDLCFGVMECRVDGRTGTS
ncbi:hypothetical protein P7C73_g4295, partial [Tremellales sp. Uapishka_1]